MNRLLKSTILGFLATCLVVNGLAQNIRPVTGDADLSVFASASNHHVRFTAASSVVQMRLEAYDLRGRKIFDNELRGGNVMDWHLETGQGQTLADGSYLCLITVKSLSGRMTQKIASISVNNTDVSMQVIDASQVPPQLAEAIGPLQEDASVVVLKENETQTGTLIAHNGEEGQIVRGQGALSFRIGDFFRGKDAEQMRLTPEGNLGIGIAHPQVRLDVDGLIRTNQGIVFPDGTVQYSAASRTFGAASLNPGSSKNKNARGQEHPDDLSPNISGTGTTGTIAKWLDGPAGVLSDSNLTEVTGSIGINGLPDTRFKLDVNGTTRLRGSNPAFNLEGLRPGGNKWVFQTVDDDGRFRVFGQDNVNPGIERLTISLSTGNMGIGATAPNTKLTVWTPSAGGVQEGIRINNPVGFIGNNNGSALVFSQDRSPSENFVDAKIVGAQELADTSGNAYLAFSTKSAGAVSEKMRVTGIGRVGIGTTSPQAALEVRGDVRLGSNGQLFAPASGENLRIVRGYIDKNGDIKAGSGFSVFHTDAGIYDIVFSPPFTGLPAIVATVDLCDSVQSCSQTFLIHTDSVTTSFVRFFVWKEIGVSLESQPFHFIAIGAR